MNAPKKKKKNLIIGKKYIIKVQLIENDDNKKNIHCQVELEGRKADLTILKQIPLKIARKTKIKVDFGYQGIKAIRPNSQTPTKKKLKMVNSLINKNKKLRKKRVYLEHTDRRLK